MGFRPGTGRQQALGGRLYDDFEVTEDCEWCQNHESVGLFDLNDVETGLCAECAEDNDAERCE